MRRLLGGLAVVGLLTACASSAGSTNQAETTPTYDHYEVVVDGHEIHVVCDPHGFRVFVFKTGYGAAMSTESDESWKR